jgi:hypothetical protein
MPPSKIRQFTMLSQLIDWPFVVHGGGDESIKVKVDDARSAAQSVRVHLSAPPLAYRAALEQLVDALRTLKRELDL